MCLTGDTSDQSVYVFFLIFIWQCTDVCIFFNVGLTGECIFSFQLLDNYTGVCLFLIIGSTGVLNFFTVSLILCPTPIFSLSSLEPKSLRMVILTNTLVQVLCVSSIAKTLY